LFVQNENKKGRENTAVAMRQYTIAISLLKGTTFRSTNERHDLWDTIVSPYVVPRVIVYLLVLYRLTTVTSDTTVL